MEISKELFWAMLAVCKSDSFECTKCSYEEECNSLEESG